MITETSIHRMFSFIIEFEEVSVFSSCILLFHDWSKSASHCKAQWSHPQKLDSLLLIAAVFVTGDWGQCSLLPASTTSKQIYHLITCFRHTHHHMFGTFLSNNLGQMDLFPEAIDYEFISFFSGLSSFQNTILSEKNLFSVAFIETWVHKTLTNWH